MAPLRNSAKLANSLRPKPFLKLQCRTHFSTVMIGVWVRDEPMFRRESVFSFRARRYVWKTACHPSSWALSTPRPQHESRAGRWTAGAAAASRGSVGGKRRRPEDSQGDVLSQRRGSRPQESGTAGRLAPREIGTAA